MEKIIHIHIPFNLPDEFDPAYKDSIKEFIRCRDEICNRFGVRAIPKFKFKHYGLYGDAAKSLMGVIDIQLPIDIDDTIDINLTKIIYNDICKYCKDHDHVTIVIAEDVVMDALK